VRFRPAPLASVLLGTVLLGTPVRADPAADYMLHCRGCHGPDGAGVPPDVPDLRGELGRLVQRPGGREFVLRVPGVAQSELNDARTAALLNWLVAVFGEIQPGPDFLPFTAAEVTRHRRNPLVDVDAARPH
jgi:hypothetical protein